MFIDLATMLMYAQIAWNIGRRFEDINAAIECKLAGFQTDATVKFDYSHHDRSCRPSQRVWTLAGYTAVVVSANSMAKADRQYGTSLKKNNSIYDQYVLSKM